MREIKDWGEEPSSEGQIETRNSDGLTPPDSVDALYDPKVRRFQLAQETREAILAGHKATPKASAIPEPVHPATDEKEG